MAHVADHLSFATLADLEQVVTERCRVLHRDQLKPGTNFHWWPKPDIPARSAGNRITNRARYSLAHLIRDVQYAIDASDAAFAPGVIGLLKRAVGIDRKRQTLADTTLVLYESRLQKRLNTLLAITPTTAAGQKLQRIIKRFRQNLFVFVTNRAVPPTNNGYEQALRPCVVFRKVT